MQDATSPSRRLAQHEELRRARRRRPRHGDGAVQAEADFVQRKVEEVGRAQSQPRQRGGKGVAQVPRPRVRAPRLRDEQQVAARPQRFVSSGGFASRDLVFRRRKVRAHGPGHRAPAEARGTNSGKVARSVGCRGAEPGSDVFPVCALLAAGCSRLKSELR